MAYLVLSEFQCRLGWLLILIYTFRYFAITFYVTAHLGLFKNPAYTYKCSQRLLFYSTQP